MAKHVDGLDVASGKELRVALDSGMDPKEISFAGPGKTETELAQAVSAGILLNVESEREVRCWRNLSDRVQRPRVAVRVNPDFELKSSGMKMGGGPKQFGVDAEQVPLLLEKIGQLGTGVRRLSHLHRFAEPAGGGDLRGAAQVFRASRATREVRSGAGARAQYRRRIRHPLLSRRSSSRSRPYRAQPARSGQAIEGKLPGSRSWWSLAATWWVKRGSTSAGSSTGRSRAATCFS